MCSFKINLISNVFLMIVLPKGITQDLECDAATLFDPLILSTESFICFYTSMKTNTLG